MNDRYNPLAPRPLGGAGSVARIKDWVRMALKIEDGVTIAVSQLTCRDAGCPDIETVVGVIRKGEPTQIVRIHKSLDDVALADVEKATRDTDTILPAGN